MPVPQHTPTKAPARAIRRTMYASGIALAVTASTLGTMPAIAQEQDGATTFSSSFEAEDVAPVLEGTGESVNLAGERGHPGSILDLVASVSASDENDPNEVAENLADGDSGTKWLSFSHPAWVQYELSEPHSIEQYVLTSANDAEDRDPDTFTIEGSTNGTDWETIDEQSDVRFDARHETLTFDLDEPTAEYTHYRLDISAVRGDVDLVQLADWTLIGDADAQTDPSDLALEIGDGPTSSYTAKTNVGWSGLQALQYSGRHLASGPAASTSVLFDDLAIAVEQDTELSYMIFPDLDGEQTYAATFVAVDLVFDDGSTLSGSEATDSYGYSVDARTQGYANKLWPDQWNRIAVDLGPFAGKTITEIRFSYDHPGDDVQNVEVATGDTAFSGWLDDVTIEHAEPVDTADGLVSYVDTRRGTNSTGGFSRGNHIPAAAWPNGFNFLVPMTNADNHGTIYHYHQNNTSNNLPALQGIGFSHQPSIWMGDRNQLAVLPADNANPTSTLNDRRLEFQHDNEVARPDIYSVEFENGIFTEVVPTDHGAVYRFTFAEDENSVLVDSVEGQANLEIAADGTVTGWVDGGSGYPGRSRMFIYGTFDGTPISAGDAPQGDREHAQYAAFDTADGETVELRIATSMISLDQAAHNHALELDGQSFDALHSAVTNAWNERLSVIKDVQGATDTQLATLYSSLYRLNLYPNSQFENVGTAEEPEYRYASPFEQTGEANDTETNATIVDGKIYVNNGFWDTYRTAWPLYAMLYPEQTGELVDGFVEHYREGGWLSRWSSPGYADLMTGTSSDVAFAEAYMAGSLSTETALEAYDAAVKNATVLPESSAVGRKGLERSIFLGFTHASTHESASWGLEGFINDFGIATMARALAEDPETPEDRVEQLLEEADYFDNRAQNFVEMYNPDAGVFTARNADGTWPEGEDFDKKAWGGAFTEASGWTFAFHAPHDVDGMAALYGGRDGLLDELYDFFNERERADRSGIHEAREARDVRLGMLGLSNQVAHHIPYVLAEAGDPSMAQEMLSDIQQRMFVGGDIGQGFPGDEDNGEFSAWYIFSALGFYPLEVGSGNYTIGSPLFDSITLDVEGTEITIESEGAATGSMYVDGIDINGTALTETTFDGQLLRDGGTMTFTMSDEPSTWGAKDLTEDLDVPTPLVDATHPDHGTLTATDGTPVGSLVDDNMNSSTTFESDEAELVWTSDSGPVAVDRYTLTSVESDGTPTSWTLSGSVDGSTWVELDSRSDENFQWLTQTRPFSVDEAGGFTSYKLEVSSAEGALRLAEIELYARSAGDSDLEVRPASSQTVSVDEEFSGTLATILGQEETADGYTVVVDYGDGSSTDEVTLTRDGLGAWTVRAPHTFDAPGTYTVGISVSDSSGNTAATSTTVHVTRDYTLEGMFNVVCIGDVGAVAADCDGQQYGYDRTKLAEDGFVQGETYELDGTELTFDLPDVEPGEPDNITGEGQTVWVDLGDDATEIAFIGMANEGDRDQEVTLHFTDGSTQTVALAFGDWVGAAGDPAFDNTVLAVVDDRLQGVEEEGQGKNTAIYSTAPVALDVDEQGEPKVVERLEMPTEPGNLRDGRVHVFAVASDGDRSSSNLLEVEASTVPDQVAGERFETELATVTGGYDAETATVNWGDGSPVSTIQLADAAVVGEHTYAEPGTFTVTVTVDDGVRSASVELEIVVEDPDSGYLPEIELSVDRAAPGDTVGVQGSGFAPGESVDVWIVDDETVDATANDAGEIDTTITVPTDLTDGEYVVVAFGEESNAEARATLFVESSDGDDPVATGVSLSAEPTDIVAGERVTLTATVTPENATGQVEFVSDESVVATASVNGGTASAEVTLETAGTHTFTAHYVPDDEAEFQASVSEPVSIEVGDVPVLDAELSLSSDRVAQGGTVEVTGRGFGSGEEVALTLFSDPVDLGTFEADEVGSFRATVTIPDETEVGDHVIEAVGGTTGLAAEAPLTVTSGDDSGDDIPVTGATIPVWLVVIMLALLIGGGALLLLRRSTSTRE
ncbi:GH92 family glycosyl hydrolase [uncultured Agrococcus sp.]|uniref:GH92 family glycosyl hydrolase n=1 Tax=uncultured Agrococcus sp. TaxID=382258 RepID=UPI0025D7089D|nr:GH92 family glycosyl hydrolase [uncultured Agrococcus sp.]